MNTRERLLTYRKLYRIDPEKAKQFVNDNHHDKRFVSLVEIGIAFIAGFLRHWKHGSEPKKKV